MTLPHSMDYLMNAGVLDFDAAAYLNSNAGGVQYPQMLGGVQMQSQPKTDSFASKAKAKFSDTNFLKKVATGVIVATLAFVGIKKGKKCIDVFKNSDKTQAVMNGLSSAKNSVSNFFSRFKK